jgi:GNAT superfamily N-acetyltransferase
MQKKKIKYRLMKPGEEDEVCDLIAEAFNEFIAPGYTEEGVLRFYMYANPETMAERQGDDHFCMVAELDGRVIGMIEIRNHNHISLLFVKERGKGIARGLFEHAIAECLVNEPALKELTVHSSPYAVPIYERLGFTATDAERIENGIVYVPMKYSIQSG